MNPSALLELRDVAQRYGRDPVVQGIGFSIARGQIVCLLGPSGCGKTTVLRTIAGFEPIERGEILLNGEVVTRPGYRLPPERRRVGMVFQDYALFPHLSVADNVGFGLHGLKAAERQHRVEELLERLGLAALAQRAPYELSGGQQQRVALARALAPRPLLLLMDEPFSSLDVELRERLSFEVRAILKEHDVTALMVTHHQHEAFAMGDEIGVMAEGHLQQWDSAYNLYHEPRNRFVADFIGEGVFVPGTVLNAETIEIELGILKAAAAAQFSRGAAIDVLLRPDDLLHDDGSALKAEVVHKAFRGADILYSLRLPSGGMALSLVPSHHNHALGERIGIRVAPDHVVCFAR